jgi:hypothetical protein
MTRPRIRIRPTPANDFYVLLCRLAPSDAIVQLLGDPGRLIRDRRAEFRFLRQLAESYGLFGQTADHPTNVPSPNTAETAMHPSERGTKEPVGTRGSILR